MRREWGWSAGVFIAAIAAVPVAAQGPTHRFDIPAQPLSTALLEFARQSDTLILVSPGLIKGKTSSPLSAVLTVHDALAQLLRGTNLHAIPNAKGGYRVERHDVGRLLAAAWPAAATLGVLSLA